MSSGTQGVRAIWGRLQPLIRAKEATRSSEEMFPAGDRGDTESQGSDEDLQAAEGGHGLHLL